jgi:nucleoid DNA-binding protein/cell division septation protein DedD
MIELLSKAIFQLLEKHDCVIFPSFGGFVANYQPAQIHPTQHIFTPPNRKIAFNKSLVSNDGLLIGYISSHNDFSFLSARQMVEEVAKEIRNRIHAGERVELTGIGTLFLDVEKNIQFTPSTGTQLLDQAFGLSEFQAPAIKREGNLPINKPFVDRPRIAPESFKNRKTKKRRLLWMAAIPAVASIVLFSFLNDSANQAISGFTDLLSSGFKNNETAIYRAGETNFNLEAETFEVPVNTIAELSASDEVNTTAPADHQTEVAVAETTYADVKTAQQKSVSNQYQTASQGDWLIIAGCFQEYSNAERLIAQLAERNITANIAGQNKSGLYRVSCGSFNSYTSAQGELEQLRNQVPEAWILSPNRY